MKQLFLSVLFALTTAAATGQRNLAPNPYLMPKTATGKETRHLSSMSPMTAFLLLDLRAAGNVRLTEAQLIEKYALLRKGAILYAKAFIAVKNPAGLETLRGEGVLTGTQSGNLTTALIPLNRLEALCAHPALAYIEIGEKASLQMDSARAATNVNQVWSGVSLPRSYSGNGVVVGIIDGGFDYTHPNFYDSTGISGYRVKRVWDQSATSGTPPAGYSYGNELTTQSAILSEKYDMFGDSHATHVAGIAAGAGGGVSKTYSGVAPKADLVFVSTTLSSPDILDGIAYIQNYAATVGKPCVINISIGGHAGPHDGTSAFDRMCDSAFTGEGRILIGSAGNDGEQNLFLGKTFTATDTSFYTFVAFPSSAKRSSGASSIDIWGEPGADFHAGVYIYNIHTNTFEDATPRLYSGATTGTYTDTLYDNDPTSPDSCLVRVSSGISHVNNKPHMTISIDNTSQDDSFRFVMLEIRAASTQTRMWAASGHAVFADNSYAAPVLAGSSNSTVGEIGGTGNSIIAVGAYTTKNAWTSLNSGNQRAGFYTANGAIAPFSSKGPTADGRTKPDIAAPGNVIVSSVNSIDSFYIPSDPKTVASITRGTNTWRFGTMQGTSMAAPMVTGIIALWLEMYPDLTPAQAKSLLQSSAITDTFTHTIPAAGSNTWGHGKANAWVNLPALLPTQPAVLPATASICAGASATLTAPAGYAGYKWSNGDTSRAITVNAAGTYKVKVKNSAGYNSPWSNGVAVTVNPVPPIPTITQNVDTLFSSAISGNQWYKNGALLSGATGQKYVVTSAGNYKVAVTNTAGCSSESAVISTQPTSIIDLENAAGLTMYPNPINQLLHVRSGKPYKELFYFIYDNLGRALLSGKISDVNKGETRTLNLSALPTGIYNLVLSDSEMRHSTQITIAR